MRSRIGGLTAVLAFSMAITGCLSPKERLTARQVALGDNRFADLLATESFRVSHVREPSYDSSSEAVVEITFAQPVPMSEWPADACSVAESSSPATGARWLIDLEGETILAVTPLWNDTACFEA